MYWQRRARQCPTRQHPSTISGVGRWSSVKQTSTRAARARRQGPWGGGGVDVGLIQHRHRRPSFVPPLLRGRSVLAGHEERGCGSLLGPAHGTDCPGASARALCGSRGGAATGDCGRGAALQWGEAPNGCRVVLHFSAAVSRKKAGSFEHSFTT